MDNMQHIYICDNSVEGLLSSIYESYYSTDDVYDIIFNNKLQGCFTYEYKTIETNFDNAQKVAYAIKTKISKIAFENIVNAWLSEAPLCGHHILEYVQLGFEKGGNVNSMLTHENVAFILKMNRKVEFETHRLLGICRFSKMQDGTYMSTISPDHNILPLMADHFSSRLSTERIVIYDEKRKTAVLSNKGDWFIANNIQIKNQNLSDDEFAFREMWQRYFETIAIKERTNKKLQRSFIPTRYWKNITELKDEKF